jgi:glycosyltransferase involved in cell wall biosynthesis
MPMNIKWRKSGGIPISGAADRLIRRGNNARSYQDWDDAADLYGKALKHDHGLPHIWIQLGHMLKEAGRPDEAATAYEEAFAQRPGDPEPLVHLAHMRKMQGKRQAAATAFIRLICLIGCDTSALHELSLILAPIWRTDAASLCRAIRHAAPPIPPQSNPAAAAAALNRLLAAPDVVGSDDAAILRSATTLLERIGAEQQARLQHQKPGIVFDVTDLIAHFRHHRLPTGIQRVQIEVIARALPDSALDGRVCCFVDGRDDLADIPVPLFMELAAMSTSGNNREDPEWEALLARFVLRVFLADPFAFRQDDTLVNMGTSWWVYNYFLIVRNAKRDFGIRYIPLVYDLIPVMAADHCVKGVIEDYVSWLVSVFDHADCFFVISRSTGDDLLRVAQRLGHNLDPAQIEVVPLDADFRQPAARALASSELSRWNLAEMDYCLFVSTIESRKNHVLALDAWAHLIETYGTKAIPMLVCVGRSGWLNQAFFERLDRNPRLRNHVKLIERASDDELALLYRQCDFTVYPSHYEGWGLPVTESLCYGRVPVVADNSSLREAGGEFAIFFESNSVTSLVSALERILFEKGCREALEEEIAARYRPRSWASIAAQVTRSVEGSRMTSAFPILPQAVLGRYYPVSLYKGSRIWRGLSSGEIFRVGKGWLWPDPEGCRTTAAGARLQIRVAGEQKCLRLYLRLRGLDRKESSFVVSADDKIVVSGRLAAGEQRWVLGDIPAISDNGIVSILVRGGSTEEIEMTTGGTLKQFRASINVTGFALLEQADKDGRLNFVENAALADLHQIGAYAEHVYAE